MWWSNISCFIDGWIVDYNNYNNYSISMIFPWNLDIGVSFVSKGSELNTRFLSMMHIELIMQHQEMTKQKFNMKNIIHFPFVKTLSDRSNNPTFNACQKSFRNENHSMYPRYNESKLYEINMIAL